MSYGKINSDRRGFDDGRDPEAKMDSRGISGDGTRQRGKARISQRRNLLDVGGEPQPQSHSWAIRLRSLHAQLRKRPCMSTPAICASRSVGPGCTPIPTSASSAIQQQLEDEQQDTLLNPTVIIEVLSPSTESYDRGRKFQHYRALASLQEYVLIAQDSARIERYLRQPSGEWLLADATGLDAVIELARFNARSRSPTCTRRSASSSVKRSAPPPSPRPSARSRSAPCRRLLFAASESRTPGRKASFQRRRQRLDIDVRHEQAVDAVLHHFRVAAFVAGDHRRARRAGFPAACATAPRSRNTARRNRRLSCTAASARG